MHGRDADYFKELQTQTGWGRTLHGFALWCSPQPHWLTLDVGCGPGLLPAIFSQLGCRACGVDLDPEMFKPAPLHPKVAAANVYAFPFPAGTFDLVTASNLLFLLAEPEKAITEMKRMLEDGGKLAMLNPSEFLTVQAATAFAAEKNLDGLARDTLINWARRAEEKKHWNDEQTGQLFEHAGMKYMGSILKVGPGFGRFSWGIA
jgi:SAM-dependent methyltransferase